MWVRVGPGAGIIFTNRCIKEDNAWLPKRAGAGEAAVTDKKGRKLVASCWTAPAKLVVFDVLPPAKSMKDGNELPADSYYELLVHLVYRAFFAMAFVLSRLYNHAASKIHMITSPLFENDLQARMWI